MPTSQVDGEIDWASLISNLDTGKNANVPFQYGAFQPQNQLMFSMAPELLSPSLRGDPDMPSRGVRLVQF